MNLLRILLIGILMVLGGCSAGGSEGGGSALRRAEFSRICMGVETRVVLYARDHETARNAAAEAFSRISDIEQALSDYRPESEAMRLCASPVGVPVAVSEDLFAALELSHEMAEASGGAFDVTVGPASKLWREMRRTGTLPAPALLDAAHAAVDGRAVELDHAARTVTLTRPGVQLDFGGIGKGMGAQAAVDLLRQRGCSRCLVALAGDIVVGDTPPPPGATGWVVALSTGGAGSATNEVELTNFAISTSGDAEQFVEIDGRRYSHILDPRTGLGIPDLRRVTVLAPRGELADALATAACVVGPEGIPGLVERFAGTGAVFVERAGGNTRETVVDPQGVLRRARKPRLAEMGGSR